MRRRSIAILLVVFVALVPTWYAAAQPTEHAMEVGIDADQTDMRPLQSMIDTPQAFTPAQVGVIIWIALGFLFLVLAGMHRFMEHSVRPTGESEIHPTDRGKGWLNTENRRVTTYLKPTESRDGLLVILSLAAFTVVLSMLLVVELFTVARTQYFGLYVGGIFLGLAAMTAGYYAWFMPHVSVAEVRYHD